MSCSDHQASPLPVPRTGRATASATLPGGICGAHLHTLPVLSLPSGVQQSLGEVGWPCSSTSTQRQQARYTHMLQHTGGHMCQHKPSTLRPSWPCQPVIVIGWLVKPCFGIRSQSQLLPTHAIDISDEASCYAVCLAGTLSMQVLLMLATKGSPVAADYA
jgi:hypothetical protein